MLRAYGRTGVLHLSRARASQSRCPFARPPGPPHQRVCQCGSALGGARPSPCRLAPLKGAAPELPRSHVAESGDSIGRCRTAAPLATPPPPPYWPGGQTAPSARHSPQACRPAARVQRLMHLHDLAECGGSAQTTDRQLHSALSRLGQSAGSGSSHPVSERKEGDGGCRGRPLSGRRAQTRPRRGWCPLSGPCGDGGGQR